MIDLDDRMLLDAWKQGEPAAGQELIRRCMPAVYRFFTNKVDAEHLDDLAQQTFLGCVDRHEHIKEVPGFLPYLLGIARKQLLMHFRRLKRTPPDPLRDSVHGLVDVQRPSGAIAAAQDRHYLLMALRRLPIDLQIVLELYYWEDLSLAGVASVIDVPLGTVKSRLGRAKDALRKHLAELPLSEGAATASRTALDQWARGLRARGSP